MNGFSNFSNQQNSFVYWQKTDQLSTLENINKNFENKIQTVQQPPLNFLGFRKLKSDSDTLYSSILLRYLQIICSSFDDNNILNFIEILKRLQNLNDERISSLKPSVSELLNSFEHKLLPSRKEHKSEAFKHVIQNIQNPDFNQMIAKVARLITFARVFKKEDNDACFTFIEKKVMIDAIIDPYQEAEEPMINFLASGLKCNVVQYNFFVTVCKEEFPKKNFNTNIKIHLLRNYDKYFLLYTTQDLENEQYSFTKSKYFIKEYFEILSKEDS